MERASLDVDELEGVPQHCKVHYRTLDRDAPCDRIAALMRSELNIPTSVRIVVRPSRSMHYDALGRLLQSLNYAGYQVEFPSHLLGRVFADAPQA